ncbi:hypothetical protein D3C85_934930 [compost metagenome]
MAGVVAQPFGDFAVAFRGEGDGAADLQDHLRAGLADAGHQLVGERQALGALAVGFATVHVEHAGAGVVAVDGLLDLRIQGDRDVLEEVGRLPFRPVGSGGDDQFLHVFDKQRTIDKVHGVILSNDVGVTLDGSLDQNGLSPMIAARSILRWQAG